MKIALINASPKAKDSTSEVLLCDLKRALFGKCELESLKLRKTSADEDTLEKLRESDVWVFASPLYVDGVPSHFLNCLIELEKEGKNKKIYSIFNCGFYEGEQNRFALDVIKNWCKKSSADWCGGVGVGAGGCIPTFKDAKPGKSPKKTVENELNLFAKTILDGEKQENRYVTMGMPKFLYKTAAEIGWKLKIKSNGGKIKDLYKKY